MEQNDKTQFSRTRLLLFSLISTSLFLILIEVSSWVVLKIYYSYKPSPVSEVNKYIERFHPLFRDNSDLNPDGVQYDPLVGYRLMPNATFFRPEPSHDSRLETDSLGLIHNGDKEKNVQLFEKKEVFRIVLFGGSTMAGRGASSNDQTIAAHLEKRLTEKFPNRIFHVVNAGVWGYTSIQERVYYSQFFRIKKPNVVVFMDGTNESFVPALHPTYTPRGGDMSLTQEGYRKVFNTVSGPLNLAIKNFSSFPEQSYLLYAFNKVLSKTGGAGSHGPSQVEEFRFWPDAAIDLQNNWTSIADEASRANSKAIFILQPILSREKKALSAIESGILDNLDKRYPEYESSNSKYWTSFRAAAFSMIEDTKRLNIKPEFIDLSTIFNDTSQHIYESSWHYNNIGNQIIARQIESRISMLIESELQGQHCRLEIINVSGQARGCAE